MKEEKINLTEEDIKLLQEKLVQTCLDFINEKNIGDLERISFSADMLQESAKYGCWQPCTDSSICAWGLDNEEGYKFLCQYC